MIQLTDEAEILFRQIHPNHMRAGVPLSDRFRPSPKDEGKLSVDRSSLVTAAESFDRFISNGFASAAVYGVTVGECFAENLPSFEDPIAESETLKANAAHAIIDFQGFPEKNWKNIARRLHLKAVARGQQHP